MKKLIKWLGYILIAASVVMGLWVSLGVYFCGGLLQIATLTVTNVIIGMCKVLFFWVPGIVVFVIGEILGVLMIEWGEDI